MGTLALAGTAIALMTPVSAHQAHRAIYADGRFSQPGEQIACVADGFAQNCTLANTVAFTDPVLGPAEVVGTTGVRVTRGRHGYRVRIVIPDHFDIYGTAPAN